MRSNFVVKICLCFLLYSLVVADSKAAGFDKYVQTGMSDMLQEQSFSDVDDAKISTLYVETLDLGFIFDNFKLTEQASKIGAVGPFYDSINFPDGSKFRGFRPFYSYSYNSKNDRTIIDVLWPLASEKEFNDERLTRILTYYKLDYEVSNPYSKYAASVFPLLFWGRSNVGKGYFALFPVGGRIGNFLGISELEFVLAPLYIKYHTNGMNSYNFLWPIFNYTTGAEVKRYRVWPLYGRNINEDVWAKHFVLWPIWTDVTYHVEGSKGYSFILFPLYGQTRMQNQSTTWVIPPLFRFTFSEPQDLIYCPWPFFQYMKGVQNKLYFWPIWGTKERDGVRRDFYLWPLMSRRYTQRPAMTMASFQFIPFFYYENRLEVLRERAADLTTEDMLNKELDYSNYPIVESESKSKYVKIWPIYSYRRLDENYAVRVLDLWPGRSWAALERNYAPFWTVYSHYKLEDLTSDTLLWGLWRYRTIDDYKSASFFPLYNQVRDTDKFKWNVLYGLIGYNREEEAKYIKFLYFIKYRFGEKKEQSNHDN
jgi:hypothetical protein